MALNFGAPDKQTDDELLEGITFWKGRQSDLAATGESEAAEQAGEQAEKLRQEAITRGLIAPA